MGSIKEAIAKNIRYFRQKAGLSQKDLAERLEVGPSAVSNWEKGRNSVDIDSLFKICSVLGVSANDIYGISGNDSLVLEIDERERLLQLRAIDDYGRAAVDAVLAVEYQRCLSTIENPRCAEVREAPAPYVTIPLAGPAAAGAAHLYEDPAYDTVQVQSIPRGAQITYTITGHSMEPLILKGSLVFVRPQERVENGEIAIIELNSEGITCKRVVRNGNDEVIELRSENPDYEPITEWDSLRIIGKVLL